jgi:hypothetical protein
MNQNLKLIKTIQAIINQLFNNKLKLLTIIILIGLTAFTVNNTINQNNTVKETIEKRIFKQFPGVRQISLKNIGFEQYQDPNLFNKFNNPQYTFILNNENDVLGGFIVKLKRNYPLMNLSIEKDEDIQAFTSQSNQLNFDKLVKEARETNLLTNIDNQLIIGGDKEEKRITQEDIYFDNIRKNKYNKDRFVKGDVIKDFSLFTKGSDRKLYTKLDIRTDLSSYEEQTLLSDPLYPKAKFIGLKYKGPVNYPANATEEESCKTCKYGDAYFANTVLEKIIIATFDRRIIEVPIKADGYFDFEAVKNQLQ